MAQQPDSSKAKDKAAAQLPAGAADLAAIRAESLKFIAAFNAGDAQALAALWTREGEYVDEAGEKFSGREAIEKQYGQFFAAQPGHKLKVVIDSLKLLSDSAAIEDGRAMLEPAPRGAPASSRYTAVHVKIDGRWQMSAVRDSRLETPSTYRHVADLEWLIGVWTAEEAGAKTESVCRWVANKSFVERSYTVTRADGVESSGVQLIGWNPQAGHVQSWTFSSDGGHAIGIWTPREGGWSAEMHGTLGDGTSTAATNLLTRLDDSAYAWQSVQRSVAGQRLADTEEIILKRKVR